MPELRSTRDRRRPAGATSASVIAVVIGGFVLAGAGFWFGRTWNQPVVAPAPGGDAVVAARTDVPTDGTRPPTARTTPASADPAHAGHDHGPTASPAPAGPPPFEFDPPMVDFGDVGTDVEMEGSFLVRNVTDRPLKIEKMAADCKCTTIADLSGTVIPPGEAVEVTAVMEARSTPGTKKSEIRFVFAGYPDVAKVPILSAVVLPIITNPTHIVPTDGLTGETALRAADGKAFRVLSVNGETPVYADDFDPGSGEIRSAYRLKWDLTAYDPRTCRDAEGKRMPRWWVIETDHPDAPVVDLQVRHTPCTLPEPLNGRLWILNLARAQVHSIPAGESAEFSTFLKWIRKSRPNDTIREVRSESDLFDAELIDTQRDGDRITCRVRITPKPGHVGAILGDIRFYGYTPGQSQRLTVIGRVVEPERQASRR